MVALPPRSVMWRIERRLGPRRQRRAGVMWCVRRPDQLNALVGCAALGFVIGILAAGITHEKVLAESARPAAAAPAARVFASDAGLVLNFIKPDKTGDFEAVIAKLKEALQHSDKPERK